MPPKAIGQYRIISMLGSGGIGSVYRAFDARTGDEVALKLLSSGPALDPVAARRMAREFEALQDLSHENVVRVFDAGVWRGYPYLVMELIEGLTLREYLSIDAYGMPAMHSALGRKPDESSSDDDEDDSSASAESPRACFGLDHLAEEPDSDPYFAADHVSGRGPEALRRLADVIDEPMTDEGDTFDDGLAPARPLVAAAATLARAPSPNLADLNRPERIALLKDALLQICDALAYVHARGLVHRDLKPSNIMVDEDRRAKLMDFGLAKYLAEDSEVTATGRIVGTYRYMAPEQLLGETIDGRTDLYSLGVMVYELLAGRPPFEGKGPVEMCHKVLEQEALPLLHANPGADEQLARIAHRLMNKDASERYQTAEEVYEVLSE
ncbi:MAG TPA: serine/threonine protein kinase [Myxococcales bacterium]|nr:serine/threonine protein kinase [Myxococcales bacterium]